VLIFVARPLSVLLSTLRSPLSWRERLFIAWIAPRGIVAASVASIFSFQLVESGVEEAARLVPIMFLVIIVTVTLYSLTARWVANRLRLSSPDPNGVLIVGAHAWARELALTLQACGIKVLMVDTNPGNVADAQAAGLPAHHGNILADHILEEMDLTGIGRSIAVTANDEVNSLAALHLTEVFGRSNVYHLPVEKEVTAHLSGRRLFSPTATFRALERRFEGGAQIRCQPVDGPNGPAAALRASPTFLPLFVLTEDGGVQFVSTEAELRPRAGQKVASLVESGG
jgi:FlaA1/EpsC-like NDP-sugar epimerase